MAAYRVLFIEHDEGFGSIYSTLERMPDVDAFWAKTIAKAEDLLSSNRFDLVLTDAYFPSKDGAGTGNDWFGLPTIVEAVRAKDNERVKIIVLTFFTAKLIEEGRNDIERIDEVWDKGASMSDFIHWQVTRLIRRNRMRLPGHPLIVGLLEQLSEENRHDLPWRERMYEMLSIYRNRVGEKQQVDSIEAQLIKIATKIGLAEFGPLWKKFRESELFNVAGRPKAWGHVRHVVNVFWLGYYFLNCTGLDRRAVYDRAFPDRTADSDEDAAMAINVAWFFAALLHDVGLFAERFPELASTSVKTLEMYPFLQYGDMGKYETVNPVLDEKNLTDEHMHRLESRMGTESVGKWFRKAQKSRLEHGFISALTMLRYLSGKSKYDDALLVAAAAAATHNFPARSNMKPSDKQWVDPPLIDYGSEPLSWLLVLCDQLQVWDRQTGQESPFSAMSFETIDLARLEVKEGVVEMTIDYVPFRHISPAGQKAKELEGDLIATIGKHTMAVLKRLDWGHPRAPAIKVVFMLYGRTQLAAWPT